MGSDETQVERWVTRGGDLNNLTLETAEGVLSAGTESWASRAQRSLPPSSRHGVAVVRVSHCGLNLADVFAALGLYSATPEGAFTPGLEFSGTVAAVVYPERHDPASAPLRVGDRVMGVSRFGGYATEIECGTQFLRRVPEEWSLAQGASFLVQAMTAWYGLFHVGRLAPPPAKAEEAETAAAEAAAEAVSGPAAAESKKNAATNAGRGRARLSSSDAAAAASDEASPAVPPLVFVHSAAGGVGLWALRFAGAAGALCVGTVGNREKAVFLESESPESQIVVRTSARCFGADLDAAMGRAVATWVHRSGAARSRNAGLAAAVPHAPGFAVALDAISGPWFHSVFDRLARGGTHILFGAADFMPTGARPNWLVLAWRWLFRPKVDPMELIASNRSVSGFNLIWLWDKEEELGAMLDDMIAAGPWPSPVVCDEFPFRDARLAMERLKGGKTIGKVVLAVESQA